MIVTYLNHSLFLKFRRPVRLWHGSCERACQHHRGYRLDQGENALNRITLLPDGDIRYDRHIVRSDVLGQLSCQIELEEGYTLRSFFGMLERYPVLAELNAFFPTYQAQYRACPRADCVCDGVDCLEFGKTVEMVGFPDKRLEIYCSLSGVSGGRRSDIKNLQIRSLLDLPVRLGSLRHVVFGDSVDTFEFDTVFTLFELIDGIAWQLGFHTDPQQCQLRR